MAVGTINSTSVGTLMTNNTITIGNSTVNVIANSSAILVGSINSTALGAQLDNDFIKIGNSSVNATFNANGATHLGGVLASSVVSKSFDVFSPVAADTYTLWHTKDAITISEIVIIQSNASAGWANLGFFSGTTLKTVVQTILSSNTANSTTGNSYTSMTFANVAANSWIWCNVGGMSAVTEIHATIRFSP